jgi:2-keto-4-pentenoate hydratase/2-oxohepta-3-ene-1,7-dioic acid hydratase in catechol pathway
MKYFRFLTETGPSFGRSLEADGLIQELQGSMFGDYKPTGKKFERNAVKLLPPCEPQGMLALWNNSRQQIGWFGRATPKEALYFYKPTSSFVTDGDPIIYPRGLVQRVVLEGEIGIVIGKKCRSVKPDEAAQCIFGYTVVNDVTAQDVVGRDKTFPQYTRGKGYDSFSVFGPCIETEVDPMALRIQSFINGKRSQDYPVTDLVMNPWEVVASISETMTLVPGDVIACGTSLGADPITEGDVVEIRIDGIGAIVNKVIYPEATG